MGFGWGFRCGRRGEFWVWRGGQLDGWRHVGMCLARVVKISSVIELRWSQVRLQITRLLSIFPELLV